MHVIWGGKHMCLSKPTLTSINYSLFCHLRADLTKIKRHYQLSRFLNFYLTKCSLLFYVSYMMKSCCE